MAENSEKSRKVGYKNPPAEYKFKPGQSGNPGGRPKDTLKAFVARELRDMDDNQKRVWLKENKISGELIWRMGEGNPQNDLTSGGETIHYNIISYGDNDSPQLSTA